MRIFEQQEHAYFHHSLDFVLMESLLHALKSPDDLPLIHEHFDSLHTNDVIGFAPVYKSNTRPKSASKDNLNWSK